MEVITEQMVNWKEDFEILKDGLVYLDNGATTQKPTVVIEAIKKYYSQQNSNVHRGIYDLSVVATQIYENAHQLVADFIHADFEEIIFTKGTTDSLNLVAASWGKKLQPGDEIVLSEMEHHSNIVPWQQIAKEKQAVVKYIPITNEGRLDMDEARKLITSKTKVVSIVHMSNVLGTINPVKELASLAHDVGAIIILDAAQSVPHMPINVKELNCDFLAFSAHKMSGPTGVGVLFGKKELLEVMEPYQFGGDMIREVTLKESTWNDLPWKFEAGTPNIAGAAGMVACIEYLQNIGMENIEKHGQELLEIALNKLSSIDGLTIVGPTETTNKGPVVSFTIKGIHPHDVSEICNQSNVALRAGNHCAMPLHEKLGVSSTTRASFYLYNTGEDIDLLVEALKKVQEVFK